MNNFTTASFHLKETRIFQSDFFSFFLGGGKVLWISSLKSRIYKTRKLFLDLLIYVHIFVIHKVQFTELIYFSPAVELNSIFK